MSAPANICVQVLYGEEEEEMMASSPEGSVIRRIWDEKIVNSFCHNL